MRVRLTKKYAENIDGVDLADHVVGEMLDLPQEEAQLLLAEKWALPDRRRFGASPSVPHRRAEDGESDGEHGPPSPLRSTAAQR
jgi:hypothetical protein